MIVKRKLYSVVDEEGNLGYYFYNESTEEEKLFNKAAYEGLTNAGKKILRQRRSDYAKHLYQSYRRDMGSIGKVAKNTPNITGLKTTGNITAGGVRTNYSAKTTKGTLDSVGNFTNVHKGTVRRQLLKGSKDAADIMRRETLAMHGIN